MNLLNEPFRPAELREGEDLHPVHGCAVGGSQMYLVKWSKVNFAQQALENL
jgi:hypothetical protein